ncbi:MAG: amino acid permease [Proteobacteria bacterium]|nr:amino acid permease [Pseudomonadota bacterium]
MEQPVSPDQKSSQKSSMGLIGATGVGVGAIVGGGVLALAGVAFKTTGPSAMLAFLLNGLLAVVTAFSYAEMSAAFPESGGTYIFSKKILSVPAAFMVGWVAWFASIIAGVLYALGFASYAVPAVAKALSFAPSLQAMVPTSKEGITLLAVTAIAVYSVALIRKSTGGGQWATWGKVVVFGVIILSGIWVLKGHSTTNLSDNLSPFFENGAVGLFQAMGYTFIALQGFDIIAAVAGEVKSPEKNIPRAMFLSLGIALAIYLPLLFVISAVGVGKGQNIAGLSLENPDTVVAVAVQNYMGPFGYWLVMIAAILAMLSALQANLLAASRVAMTMARDRALPRVLGRTNRIRGTPVSAIILTAAMGAAVIFIFGNVAAAGAAASLIFLVLFALTQWTSILARLRVGAESLPFRTPWFPGLQIVGSFACIALAVYQGIQVPLAGLIVMIWLGAGGILYLFIFARRAHIVDASAAARDPQLFLLRGRSPLVLVPIANPDNADVMVQVANALTPPKIGRVLLLSIVTSPENWHSGNPPRQLMDSQAVIKSALTASFASGLAPEALTTIAPQPWPEIIRVAGIHRCESLMLGLSDIDRPDALKSLENLMSQVDSHVIVLRAPDGWNFSSVKKVLVPFGGRGQHDQLRARLLGSLYRHGIRQIHFLQVLPQNSSAKAIFKAKKWLAEMAKDELAADVQIEVICSDNGAERIIERAADADLLILGLQRFARNQKLFGETVLQIARQTDCGLILINNKG